jgi:hypothetical protein
MFPMAPKRWSLQAMARAPSLEQAKSMCPAETAKAGRSPSREGIKALLQPLDSRFHFLGCQLRGLLGELALRLAGHLNRLLNV